MELHDLTAAYALDALDPAEQREYERHLPSCERCRAELAELQGAAGALAFAVDAPPPPPQLRERILDQARQSPRRKAQALSDLDQARGERTNVAPLHRNRPFRWAAAGAAVAAAAAVALGIWGLSLDRKLDDERSASAEIAAVLAEPDARRLPMGGATLVVDRDGRGALVLDELPDAPDGKRYMAWVIEGGKPLPAGLVDGREHLLERPVPAGATVALTVEDGEVEAPTGDPVAQATVA